MSNKMLCWQKKNGGHDTLNGEHRRRVEGWGVSESIKDVQSIAELK